ncbi:MAG: (2Fe-2S)-binding protein [Chloroflexi bacterium]|nr:(2Fe-2S)-binding protein [Chloroflexota bacterium]
MKAKHIELVVNEKAYDMTVAVNRTLLEVLREDLNLTGTKFSCEDGECGACTVLLDGKVVRSCLTLAVDVRGRKVTTIDGLSQNGELHPLQAAFIEHGAIQCGFCTPGMILSAKALLDRHPHPTEEEVRTAIDGNICRCTGYTRIVKAILVASQKIPMVS